MKVVCVTNEVLYHFEVFISPANNDFTSDRQQLSQNMPVTIFSKDIDGAHLPSQTLDHSLIVPHVSCRDIPEGPLETALSLDKLQHRQSNFEPPKRDDQAHKVPRRFQ